MTKSTIGYESNKTKRRFPGTLFLFTNIDLGKERPQVSIHYAYITSEIHISLRASVSRKAKLTRATSRTIPSQRIAGVVATESGLWFAWPTGKTGPDGIVLRITNNL